MATEMIAATTLVTATINGDATAFQCEPRDSLLDVLRDRLLLTGAKEGCNNGNCGACNVIVDGVLVNSCCVLGGGGAGFGDKDDRRRCGAGRLAPVADGVPGERGVAVRSVHAGIHRIESGAIGAKPRSERTRHTVMAGGQPVPVYWLRQDRAGRAGRRNQNA